MNRIDPLTIDTLGPLQATFAQAAEKLGFMPTDGLYMAHQPDMMQKCNDFVWSVLQGGILDPGLKRLMGLLSSAAAGCRYCQAHTSLTAQSHGISEEKLNDVWSFETSTFYSPAEKAALRLALHSGMVPNGVTDKNFEQLKAFYTDKEIIEIVFTVSVYGFLNRFNDTLKTEIEEAPKMALQRLNKNHT